MESREKRLRTRIREQSKRIAELEQENAVLRDNLERNKMTISRQDILLQNAMKEIENAKNEYIKATNAQKQAKERYQKMSSDFAELQAEYKHKMDEELKRIKRQEN